MTEHVLARAMIAEILDSFEKLEIVMYLIGQVAQSLSKRSPPASPRRRNASPTVWPGCFLMIRPACNFVPVAPSTVGPRLSSEPLARYAKTMDGGWKPLANRDVR